MGHPRQEQPENCRRLFSIPPTEMPPNPTP